MDLSRLALEYEQLLGQYCQTRDGRLYLHLTEYVMPRLTMAEEELRCARPFRRRFPGQPTPMRSPRSPAYEAFKHRHCWRFYYFDHETEAPKALAQRLRRDPECRVSRVPSIRETFHAVPLQKGVRPATLQWRGYAPPLLPGGARF